MVDNSLNPTKQCIEVTKIASATLAQVRHTFGILELDAFPITYNTYSRPILEYYIQIWSHLLEKVQRRPKKLVRVSDTNRMFSGHRSSSFLWKKGLRGDLLVTCRILSCETEEQEGLLVRSREQLRTRGYQQKPESIGVGYSTFMKSSQ